MALADQTALLQGTASTGIPGLDHILRGGLPRDRVYLLEGDPGTGKTTAALQFLRQGVGQGESCIYVTLSESANEFNAVAASHGWTLEPVDRPPPSSESSPSMPLTTSVNDGAPSSSAATIRGKTFRPPVSMPTS